MRFQKRLRECSSGVRKARPAWQALVWPFWYDPFWNGPFVWSPGTFSSLTGQKSRVELHSPDFVILPSKSGLRTYYPNARVSEVRTPNFICARFAAIAGMENL